MTPSTRKPLHIGWTGDGDKLRFELPVEALVQTFAFIGIRGSGKTSGATELAEKFTEEGLPWTALDPTGVWWGLRAGKDGDPRGGFKEVVVIGGPHGDIPLERSDGEKIAEAIVGSNVCAVIDLKYESKTAYRTFVADFCEKLGRLDPPEPRHIFIEEAPEFVPQKPKGRAMQAAHAAVNKLICLGRNSGYGASLISQRSATIDKDVLSQCENVFAFRSPHNLDRKAFKDWISGKVFDGTDFSKFLSDLAALNSGAAWFWSPSWLSTFKRILFLRRNTFHPGETRSVGAAPKSVKLCDAAEFVEKIKRQLSRKAIAKPEPKAQSTEEHPAVQACPVPASDAAIEAIRERLVKRVGELEAARSQISSLTRENQELRAKLDSVRRTLQPQYDAMKALFSELGAPTNGNGAAIVDRSSYETWLSKAPKVGIKKMLEVLIDKGAATRTQLQTLSGVAPSTGYEYIGWLRRNNLVDLDGQTIRLRPV